MVSTFTKQQAISVLMVIIIVKHFRIVIALFGFLVIISTGYELYMKLKKDANLSQKELHRNFTVSDNNGVQLNGVKAISTGDLEVKSKVFQEVSETTEQKTMNCSTVILVQHSNQDLSGKKKTQGMIFKNSHSCFVQKTLG